MLLLLLIILIIITGLIIIIIPMILIINTLLFEYGMALSCDCLLTVSNLSDAKCTPTETNRTMDNGTLQSAFSTERNVLCLSRCFLLVSSTCSSSSLKREHCTDEREMFYICNRGDCFVCTTWVLKSFRLFRKPESRVSYLPAHLQWYVFDFEKSN